MTRDAEQKPRLQRHQENQQVDVRRVERVVIRPPRCARPVTSSPSERASVKDEGLKMRTGRPSCSTGSAHGGKPTATSRNCNEPVRLEPENRFVLEDDGKRSKAKRVNVARDHAGARRTRRGNCAAIKAPRRASTQPQYVRMLGWRTPGCSAAFAAPLRRSTCVRRAGPARAGSRSIQAGPRRRPRRTRREPADAGYPAGSRAQPAGA